MTEFQTHAPTSSSFYNNKLNKQIPKTYTQPETDAARVVRYILATKSHSCDDDEEDLRLFLDIDMSVLGQPRAGELV